MRNGLIVAAALAMGLNGVAFAEEPYKVKSGDTLWGVSGKFMSEPPKWPVLWAKNPQIHNPHWIYPGDPIYLNGQQAQEAKVDEIRLPVTVLAPAPAPEPVAPAPAEAKKAVPKPQEAAPELTTAAKKARGAGTVSYDEGFAIKGARILDYISAQKAERLGTVRVVVPKDAYAQYEEVFADPSAADKLAAGDTVAIFDDSREVSHPQTGALAGYHVKIVGLAEVLTVENQVAKLKIFTSSDAITSGQGVMAYKKPAETITPSPAKSDFSGVVLCGGDEATVYTEHQIVFLDKGSAQGASAGSMLAIPFGEDVKNAEGMVIDTSSPLALLLVIATQENSSTAYVVDSRYAIENGYKFLPASNSP